MNKILKYACMAATAFMVAACTEDYKDWADPISYGPEDAITVPGVTAQSVAETIDLAAADGTVQLFNVPTDALAPDMKLANVMVDLTPVDATKDGETKTIVTDNGAVTVEEIDDIVKAAWGMRPVERTFNGHVTLNVKRDGTAVRVDAGNIVLKAIPVAPVLSTVYYITGNMQNLLDPSAEQWNANTCIAFSHSEADVYEDPAFILRYDFPAGSEFKIVSGNAYDAGNIWAENWGASDGALVKDGPNFKIEEAGIYTLKIDVLENTYTLTHEAGVIEEAYYIVGTVNGWNNSDMTYKFSHSDKDVYDDPVFTITFAAPMKEDGTRDDCWFKIFPQSAIGTWNGVLGCVTDGDTSLSGALTFDNPGAINMPASDGALYYRVTLDMKQYTYNITPIAWQPYVYLPGDANGWGFDKDILLGNGEGRYEGYAVIGGQWGWKVTEYPDWNHGDYGNGGDGKIQAGQGNIMEGSEAKQYFATVDLANMTYDLLEVTSFSIIGSVKGSWDTDVDMTPDLANRCWTVTADLAAGEFKFRVNHDWGKNLGGTYDSMVANGDNLQLPEAGNYTITLYPTYDGASHCTVVKN